MSTNHSTFKNVTRGGQITLHSFRMFGQTMRTIAFFSLCLSLCFFVWFLYVSTTSYERYILSELIDAHLRIAIHGDKVTHIIKNPNGTAMTVYASYFVNHPNVTALLTKLFNKFMTAIWLSLGINVLSFVGSIFFFRYKGKKHQESVDITGQKRVEPAVLAKIITKEGKKSDFKIAGVPLIKDSEIQHILLTGTTGAGKSCCIQELMDQVRSKNQRAVVYDIEGAFIPHYFRPGKDIILNPFDDRSPSWNIWQEGEDIADFEAMASSLMPLHLAGSDPFWIHSARTIFSSAVWRLHLDNQKNHQALLQPLFTESLGGLAHLLRNSPAESLVSEKNERTALSIKATLSTYCKSLMYLKDNATGPHFSIRRWINDEKSDGWLFITTNALKAEALRPLISVWLDVAARYVLSLSKSADRRLWFFMDELASLHKLPSLMTTLARGRKYGACFVAAIQDIHQLRTLYGRDETETLISLFNTKVCFRTNSPASAYWMSELMSRRETLEKKENYSYGANDIRDGVSIHEERRKEPVVMDTEFLNLYDLQAFMRLPGNWPVTKLIFKYQERENLQPVLVERDFQMVSLENETFVGPPKPPKIEEEIAFPKVGPDNKLPINTPPEPSLDLG